MALDRPDPRRVGSARHAAAALPGGHLGAVRRDRPDRARRPRLAARMSRDVKGGHTDAGPECPHRRGHRAHREAERRRRRRRYLDQHPRRRPSASRGARSSPAATSPTASPPAPAHDKAALAGDAKPNLAIVTAYNDMLSAHQPFERFPALIKQAAREAGGVAQFAGGVPAMCDGVTQGQPGMELSLFSRDVIALATAVALSPRHVRRRALSRHLRQDRAGPADRAP